METLEIVSDLIYYEGPVLTHAVDQDGVQYFSYWVDEDSTSYRWLIFRVDETDIYRYLKGLASLRELVLSAKNNFLILADISGDNYQNIQLVRPQALNSEYIPEETSFFEFPVPAVYQGLLARFASV